MAPKAHQHLQIAKDYVDRLAVSNTQVKAGILGVYTFDIADAASADYDRVVADKFEVIDIVVQKRGGAGGAAGTVTVKNAGNAISDAIDINDADKLLSRAASIDDAFSTIDAGGTLRVSIADSANSAVLVTVIGIVRA
jgi:hypothetical protein